jgi:aryl-alcohol dehydrogenase-like predicted oxidoreductase
MKLAIGTAQFGLRYGVANTGGQVCLDEASRILQLALDKGLDTLDTATAYGSSEDVLGSIGVTDWRVISKIPALPPDVSDVYLWVLGQVRHSLERMRLKSLDAVMMHKPSDMLGSNHKAYLRAFESIKSEGWTGAVGYSVYSPEELTDLCNLMWPDIVQVPFNVIDRRIKQSGWLDRLNERGTRVHVRSVFLQGLLLMPAQARPPWFSRWNQLLSRWDQLCVDSGASPAELALNFALDEPGIERVVVGVESSKQLAQLLDTQARQVGFILDGLACEDAELIEPYRWKLQ